MEEYIKIESFDFESILMLKDTQIIKTILGTEKGIIKTGFDNGSLRIEYNSYLIDIKEIQSLLSKAGYNFRTPKKVKRFQRFIQSLAKSNKQTFGGGKLECCKLND